MMELFFRVGVFHSLAFHCKTLNIPLGRHTLSIQSIVSIVRFSKDDQTVQWPTIIPISTKQQILLTLTH
jgi:hypothetical protein